MPFAALPAISISSLCKNENIFLPHANSCVVSTSEHYVFIHQCSSQHRRHHHQRLIGVSGVCENENSYYRKFIFISKWPILQTPNAYRPKTDSIRWFNFLYRVPNNFCPPPPPQANLEARGISAIYHWKAQLKIHMWAKFQIILITRAIFIAI